MVLEYFEVEVNYMFVDNVVMQLIFYFVQFDVIIISNMFGDIFFDVLSVLVGLLGMLFFFFVGVYISLFELIYGFYLEVVGEDCVNFLVIILLVVMFLDSL